MTVVTLQNRATIADLLKMPDDGYKHELVDGQIVVSPAGFRHSEIAARIAFIVATYLENSPIGKVYSADVGVLFPNGNLRSPDVTFVRNEKLPDGISPEGFGEVIPDLAVEVLSPGDSMRHVAQKIGEFLEMGVPLVWLVDPKRESVTVYRSLSDTEQCGMDDTIDGGTVLPGFSSRVSRFF